MSVRHVVVARIVFVADGARGRELKEEERLGWGPIRIDRNRSKGRRADGGLKVHAPYSDFPGTTASFSACKPFTSSIGSKLLSGCLYDPPALSAHVKY
jgi:hypothetical protein